MDLRTTICSVLVSATLILQAAITPQAQALDTVVYSSIPGGLIDGDKVYGAAVFNVSGFGANTGIEVGADFNVYVSDRTNARVQQLDPNTGIAINANFSTGLGTSVQGLTRGPDGNLYGADSGNLIIVKIDGTTGVSSTFATTPAGLGNPYALRFGPGGALFVTDRVNAGGIWRFSSAGASLGQFISGINSPDDLLFVGNDLLVSSSLGAVERYDAATGTPKTDFTNLINTPSGLALNFNTGNVLVASLAQTNIAEFSPTGMLLNSTAAVASGNPRFIATFPIPEPGTMTLLAIGGMMLLRRRCR